MIIFPAIDLKDGKAVRLSKGDFNNVDVFSDKPWEVAKGFEEKGAEWIHLVDLDGAKDGENKNLDVIKKIREVVNVKLQLGGGIRTLETAEMLLNMGIDRIILGTAAIENPELLKNLVEKYGEKIAVSVDEKNGKAATKGWLEESSIGAFDLCKSLKETGVKTIIYTDISKDGMMAGPNFDAYVKINKLGVDVIASGGVSTPEDISVLRKADIYGAIVGKAIYLGKIKLEEVL
ncbi:1-(5-phosphoribosyl)-5-[(5-phosphoribosylamino)methylideneamino]imidazole-4-carboxamide isomerase [uncultured Ilyobacter sp.]|uniref:1-(5-phosphoribosyl)-5-[(5- phosphoribosylamino)methylideneamino]imidazole-4- carboxamide isomerase n=1 Tax=uncultured Ilyobacter sp. TaxID=544433 RepID=UPI0029F48E41|nr:1-(5-phosphoribosyl)-5-[(5-phosphoribosylamino)methylideneamino]imidazole-4-carboxamide isomerase [uncultured Ilyobacter sp.]